MKCVADGGKAALEALERYYQETENGWNSQVHGSLTIEDSIFRPLLRQQGDMYYCTMHPDVKSIYVSSIEHHIRYADTDRHRYKLETGLDLPVESR